MKRIILTSTVLGLCWLLSIINISAQRTEPDRQIPPKVKIEYFDWYSKSETAKPPVIKDYYRRGVPEGKSANFPTEDPSGQRESEEFIYRLIIRNLSAKEIVSVVWRYEFVNPLTNELAAILEFESRVRIKPTKRKTIYAGSFLPPAPVIDVNLLLLNKKHPFLESVTVKSVVYKQISNCSND